MDFLKGELNAAVRKLHPESGGQWLYVQAEAGDEWSPSGVCLRTNTV